ncbi:hypothetical protein BCR44DRAFT_277816 [Catenaria anguillulae PL171]|uniref:Uncharacterized protein n=1 Tax=Catenaria anguillulae PL171 TaxID=765915 RepID=A0A1Y2HNW9_9FUNG|nr:hypothetical protein BCR44DRAFT_277816 [Catenaria anguillulae PL171]
MSSRRIGPRRWRRRLDCRNDGAIRTATRPRPQHRPPPTPAAQPNESRRQIATPTALLTFRKLDCRIGRYVNGQLRVRHNRTALANELISPRAWLPAQVQAHLAAINASSASQSLARRVLAFACTRGPCAPFSIADLFARQVAGAVGPRAGNKSVRTQLRPAVNAALVGHVYVLERVDPRRHADVRERLVAAAVANGSALRGVASGADLVVVAAVEMVGFEAPSAQDEVPAWAERRFVVRERYAIVV